MGVIFKGLKIILNVLVTLIMLILLVNYLILYPMQNYSGKTDINQTITNDVVPVNAVSSDIVPFVLNDNQVVYGKTNNTSNTIASSSTNSARTEVLNRAKAMTEVKWTPQYNLIDKDSVYVFLKGVTYTGIPYSMALSQAKSSSDFLSKIKGARTVYGNDCSGFVSAAWGIGRQTTLSFYNALKNKTKIEGKTISAVAWNDLKPGDAILLDNGKGKGHIVLFISFDSKNKDNLNVYEQNVATAVPLEPIPVARKDIRSMQRLNSAGYIPIRLSGLD